MRLTAFWSRRRSDEDEDEEELLLELFLDFFLSFLSFLAFLGMVGEPPRRVFSRNRKRPPSFQTTPTEAKRVMDQSSMVDSAASSAPRQRAGG